MQSAAQFTLHNRQYVRGFVQSIAKSLSYDKEKVSQHERYVECLGMATGNTYRPDHELLRLERERAGGITHKPTTSGTTV